MEAVFLPDQSFSSYNRSRNHMSLVNGFVYGRVSGNLANGSLLNVHGSLFGAPPSLSSSFSSLNPSLSSSFSSFSSFSSSGSKPQKQPPLLPLPSAKIQALPSPPPPATHRKINKGTKDQVQEPKKAKSVSFNLKKESYRSRTTTTPKDRFGPDPSELPTKVPKVMKSSSLTTASSDELEEFSGSIFSLSPPPSSLPLPKFSLRPKSRCNAEAGAVHNGATDDLRRLLRLQ
eukprot:TRINITY_DN4671_c0_g1_i1.p1 TRINITY_DN4671_c0_g1~~TRINITY_DN4671_c0_g1_i1.p1  ORF type:complete len:231 (-),score=57.19 TRINITY_DN4671_c0_g1_i1:495-1187(-)